MNVRLIRDWYTMRGQADPWMVAIGDTTDPDFSAIHARRTPPPRKPALHVRVTIGDIPRRTEPRRPYPLVAKHHRDAANIPVPAEPDAAAANRDTTAVTPPDQPG